MTTAETTLRTILTGHDESASKAIRGAANEAQGAQKHFAGLGKIAAGVFAGGALAEGAQKVGEFLKGSVEAAVEDQTANAILERQLKNTTSATGEQVKATEEWLVKTAEASGIAKSDLTPSLTKLATVTGSVGKAQKLTTLAMNVAAGTHQKLTSVTSAFVKAQNGSIGGLARLGVATKNADGTTKTFTQVQKEMAEQFKGDSAAAADTAAGKMKRLGVTWEEMKVQVGDHLLPVLTSLTGWILDDAIPSLSTFGSWVQRNSAWLAPLVTVIGGLVAGFVAYSTAVKVSTAAQGVWATVMGLTTAATEAATIATEGLVAGEVELDAAMDANPIGLVVVALGALAAGLIYAYKHSQTFRAIVDASFHGVQVVAGAVFGWIKDHWALLFVILGGPIGLAAVLIIKNFTKIENAIQVLGKWAAWLWNNAFQPAIKFIVNGIGILIDIWGHMLSALGHVPGFGWAKAAGDAMQVAADKAHAVANAIIKIPTHKDIAINIVTHHIGVHGQDSPDLSGTGSSGGAGRGHPKIGSSSGGGASAGRRGADGGSTDLGTFTMVLKGDDGVVIQRKLLRLKRDNRGLALGLA